MLFAVTSVSRARATSIEQMRHDCSVGEDPTPAGSTPTALAGVTIVSPREAKCVIDRFRDVIIIAPMRDIQQIPGAAPIVTLATPAESHAADAKIIPAVNRLTSGDLGRPLLVYCHHTNCAYSYNAALHLRGLGYTNILWLREGLKGWTAAGYKVAPLDEVRSPIDEPSYFMWAAAEKGYWKACFAKQTESGCDMKLMFGKRALADPSLTGHDRDIMVEEVMNTATVRAQNLRADGKAREAYETIRAAYADLLDYAQGGAKVGALSINAEVVGEFALASFKQGRRGDTAPFLALARKDGEAQYRRLPSLAKGAAERNDVHNSMLAMEHLERDIANYTAQEALTLYAAGKSNEAAGWRHLTDDAVDRAALWIDRNGKENVFGVMDLQPAYRLSEIKTLQGDVARAGGDRAAATKAYRIAGDAVCRLANPAAVEALMTSHQPEAADLPSAAKCVAAMRTYLDITGATGK